MAAGKTGYFDVTSGGFTLRIKWSETYDATDNTSIVTITNADLKSTTYGGYLYYPHGYIKVNGTEIVNFNSGLGTHTYYLNSNNTFCEIDAASGSPPPWGSNVIVHNDDGSKSVTIEVYISLWRTSGGAGSGTSLSESQAITLTTIPRKSTLTVENGTLDDEQTLTIIKQSDDFTHTIVASCINDSVTVCTKSKSTSISFTPPISWASQNTAGTTVPVTYTITTYNGDTSIGSNSYTTRCAIPTSVKPSVDISVSDAMGYSSIYGGYIKGLSTFKIVLSPTISYGSEIASYNITVNGATYTSSEVITDVIKTAGEITITATVKDGRGRKGSSSITVTVLDYSSPSISLLKVNRCNSDGIENDQGEYVKVTYSGSITKLSDQNAASWILYYKKTSDSEYESATLSEKTSLDMSDAVHIIPADSGSSYNIKLSVTDNFATTTSETVASTAFTMIHFNAAGNGMAIGKISEVERLFDLGLQTRFYNGVLHMIPPSGTDLNSLTLPNTYRLYGDRTYVNMPENSVGAILEVFGDSNVLQRLTILSNSSPRTYERVLSNGAWSDWISTASNIQKQLSNTIVIGNYINGMQVIINQSLTFTNGSTTLDCSSIASTYGKTIHNVIAQFKTAGTTAITSATVASNVVTLKAYNAGGSTNYSGTTACTLVLYLA